MAFPLETLRVDGNARVSVEKIIGASGLTIGQPVLGSDFDAARERLLSTGAFETVDCAYKPSPDNKGYDGRIQVVEVADVYPYRFEDLPAGDAALRELLLKQDPILDDRIPATRQVLERYEKVLDQFLGGNFAVTGKLMADAPGKLVIVFRPPVARSNIAEVRFTGNEVLPADVLTRTLSGVAIGLPYSEPGLREVLDSSIRPLYDARGRIRVAFPSVIAEKSTAKDVEGVVVTIGVREGPSYSLGAIRFAGVAQTQVAELEKTANWRHDDIVNFDNIKEGVDRIYRRLRRAGYLHVISHLDRDIHDDTHTVDLLLTIQPGPQFMFGKLTIQGLDLLTEPTIRKMWGEREGKPFDIEYPDAFLKDIREQDLFENIGQTRAETHIDEASKTVTVTLYFPGAKPVAPKDHGRGGGRGRF